MLYYESLFFWMAEEWSGEIKAPWRGGSPTARPALRRRGLVQARRPVFEALETRQMLSHYAAPIVFDSPTPVPIPVADAKAGQTVPMTIDFTTTDTTTPETSENEYLEIRGSAGYSTTILNYGTQTIHVPITANGETFSAWIDGADGDEQASILVGDRHLTYTTDLAALSTTWDDLAYGVKQTMNAIKAVTSYTPGWSVVADGNVIPNIGGTVSVGLDLCPTVPSIRRRTRSTARLRTRARSGFFGACKRSIWAFPSVSPGSWKPVRRSLPRTTASNGISAVPWT